MAESGGTATSDVLQVGDLLQGGGGNADNAAAYLHFSYDSATNATIVEVTSQADAAAAPAAKIVLSGINLTALGTDSDIITHLLSSGNSHADS
jgi:hypothetical protein